MAVGAARCGGGVHSLCLVERLVEVDMCDNILRANRIRALLSPSTPLTAPTVTTPTAAALLPAVGGAYAAAISEGGVGYGGVGRGCELTEGCAAVFLGEGVDVVRSHRMQHYDQTTHHTQHTQQSTRQTIGQSSSTERAGDVQSWENAGLVTVQCDVCVCRSRS
eukprot:COSAG06_NODE_1024_length_11038_cov_245.122406_3_plen_164_part_00